MTPNLIARLIPKRRSEPWSAPGPLDAIRIAPAAGGEARALVVMLHGRGVDAADLRHAVPALAAAVPHAAFVLPSAPNAAAGTRGGREWFTVPGRDRLTGVAREAARAAGVRAAAPVLDAFLDGALAEHRLGGERLALFGFSQGCAMALHVGLRRPCAALLGYCGRLADPAALAGEAAPDTASDPAARPPVLLCHGAWDPLAPPAAQDEAAAALRGAGVAVTTIVRPYLEHALDREGLAAGAALLARTLAG